MDSYKARELVEPTFTKVKDLLPGKAGYNLYLKVISKNVLIDITRLDKTKVVIADFVVGDETGIIKMRLRNDKLVDLINEKETIIVRNCKIVVVNTHMRMQVDAFGKIEISKDVNIDEVKMDKDMSSVVYDILPYANRTRYDGSRRDYKSDTHSQYTYDTRSHYSQQKINRNYNDNRSVMSDSHYSVGTFLSSQVGR